MANSRVAGKVLALLLARCRDHRGIENCLHQALDATFGEDSVLVKLGHDPQNWTAFHGAFNSPKSALTNSILKV